LRKALVKLNEQSKILAGRRLLDMNFTEDVDLGNGMTTWINEIIKEMYEELCDVHGIGSTSASKILHGINTRVFMMWDQYIRPGFGLYSEGAGDYLKFMAKCQSKLKKIVEDYQEKHPCDTNTAEQEICRQAYPNLKTKKPLAKLLDEYNWMKFCNKSDLPDLWPDP
jgi:endonuclease III-like uncharacterized protein